MKYVLQLATLVLVAVLPALSAPGATLGLLEDGVQLVDGEVLVPVTLASMSGESVAGFQFDLRFQADQLTLVSVDAGAEARAAEKSAHVNALQPGHLRVVVAGFNMNHMEDGPVVLARFKVETPGAGGSVLRLSDAILSDPFGSALPVRVVPDTLVLTKASARTIASSSGGTVTPAGDSSALYRYRAVLFAGVVVVFTIALTRPRPKKGRAR